MLSPTDGVEGERETSPSVYKQNYNSRKERQPKEDSSEIVFNVQLEMTEATNKIKYRENNWDILSRIADMYSHTDVNLKHTHTSAHMYTHKHMQTDRHAPTHTYAHACPNLQHKHMNGTYSKDIN